VSKHSLWLHAVSVGEILSAQELIRLLRRTFPNERLVISTITATGNAVAKSLAADDDIITYLPFDISFIIRRFIRYFNPRIFIALETELWPNVITQLSRASIPMVIVNGRISDQAYKKYKFFKLFLKPILLKVSLFAMQNSDYASKIKQLGVLDAKVRITGNMKFDVQDTADTTDVNLDLLKRNLQISNQDSLIVAGCTHKGEEELILSAFKRLRQTNTHIRLLIAPRHVQRIRELEKAVSDSGFKAVRVSSLTISAAIDGDTVYLLDTMGVLKEYYAVASIVFVGGSLVAAGGHNILEPASFAKPIIFGRYMHNFIDLRELFLASKAAIEVKDERQLLDRFEELICNPEKASALGLNARALVADNKGASERNCALIKETLSRYA
jgi:3-deoxy-D-manno-octulosonic-acid transferase